MRIIAFDADKKAYVFDIEHIATQQKNRVALGGGRFLDYYNNRWHLSQKGKNLGVFQAWELIGDSSGEYFHQSKFSSV